MTKLADIPSIWIHGAGFSASTWDSICADLPLSVAEELYDHRTEATVEGYAQQIIDRIPDPACIVASTGGRLTFAAPYAR